MINWLKRRLGLIPDVSRIHELMLLPSERVQEMREEELVKGLVGIPCYIDEAMFAAAVFPRPDGRYRIYVVREQDG